MKNKIAIIICYFGKLSPLYQIWKRSCENNSSFHFHIFTDQHIDNHKQNIFVHYCKLSDIVSLAKNKLSVDSVSLSTAYKLCDYKPMYGIIFQDYIKEYDFWGMCDMDMIFGDLSLFITDDLLSKYEKIYQLGHLTLYKNTPEVNTRFKLNGYIDWRYVISTSDHCRLCERGMMSKYSLANIPCYTPIDYADISKIHKRYQLSHWLVPKKERDRFKYQIFYYENGHVFRAVYYKGDIIIQEYNYIHLQKRKIKIPQEHIGECFFICNNTFINKKPGTPKIEDILRYNPYPGKVFEVLECIKYEIKTKNLFNRLILRAKLKVEGKI